jgi:hypothetical protein
MIEALGVRMELLQPRRWRDYYRLLRRDVFALLCLDDRRTWGRYALDAASARVPYVGSDLSQGGEDVAMMTCDPFDTDSAIEFLSVLIEERLQGRDDRYREVTDRQYAAVRAYDGDASRERMRRALKAAGLIETAVKLEPVCA